MEIIQAKDKAAQAMFEALKNLPCRCKRKYPYSGEMVKPCARCVSMAMWEEVLTGKSEIRALINTKIP